MIFEKTPRGAGKFNLFTANGAPYPHDREFVLKQGTPLPADVPQPDGRFASAASASASVRDRGDLRKGNRGHHQGYGGASLVWPGDSGLHRRSTRAGALFHCHIQHHVDYGFKALLKYA